MMGKVVKEQILTFELISMNSDLFLVFALSPEPVTKSNKVLSKALSSIELDQRILSPTAAAKKRSSLAQATFCRRQ